MDWNTEKLGRQDKRERDYKLFKAHMIQNFTTIFILKSKM